MTWHLRRASIHLHEDHQGKAPLFPAAAPQQLALICPKALRQQQLLLAHQLSLPVVNQPTFQPGDRQSDNCSLLPQHNRAPLLLCSQQHLCLQATAQKMQQVVSMQSSEACLGAPREPLLSPNLPLQSCHLHLAQTPEDTIKQPSHIERQWQSSVWQAAQNKQS